MTAQAYASILAAKQAIQAAYRVDNQHGAVVMMMKALPMGTIAYDVFGEHAHKLIQAEYLANAWAYGEWAVAEVTFRAVYDSYGNMVTRQIRVDIVNATLGTFFEIKPAWERYEGVPQVEEREEIFSNPEFQFHHTELTPGRLDEPMRIPVKWAPGWSIHAYQDSAKDGLILYEWEYSGPPPLPVPARAPGRKPSRMVPSIVPPKPGPVPVPVPW